MLSSMHRALSLLLSTVYRCYLRRDGGRRSRGWRSSHETLPQLRKEKRREGLGGKGFIEDQREREREGRENVKLPGRKNWSA